jgi:hypothetical protein
MSTPESPTRCARCKRGPVHNPARAEDVFGRLCTECITDDALALVGESLESEDA